MLAAIGRGAATHVGEQLELELGGPGLLWREPWDGKSVRGLTKAAKMFSLGAPPAGGLRGDDCSCVDRSGGQLRQQLAFSFFEGG